MNALLEAAEKIARGETAGPPVAQLIGFTLTYVEPGRAVIELEAGDGTTTRWAQSTAAYSPISPTPRWASPTRPRWPKASRSPPSS